MIFPMESCGGCRTCEMACLFKHKKEFVPSLSSIKVLDRKNGKGYMIALSERNSTQNIPCDFCTEDEIPLCVQYCEKSEDLKRILEAFKERSRLNE